MCPDLIITTCGFFSTEITGVAPRCVESPSLGGSKKNPLPFQNGSVEEYFNSKSDLSAAFSEQNLR